MGEVYAAYDPELERKVAIKLLRVGSRGADSRVRLMREAQAIAKVSHPNVVIVYDVGALQDQVFIAMEFVEGHTLRYWTLEAPRAWPEILKVFTDAGRGLVAAHEKDLVHRDFKPDNVMVGSGGHVRVMDFGLARVVNGKMAEPSSEESSIPAPSGDALGSPDEDIDSTRSLTSVGNPSRSSPPLITNLTMTGEMVGTPAYMSPEQLQGRQTDASTDQFSFCVALYEALYGERPFEGKTISTLVENVLRGTVREAPAPCDVPAGIRQILLRGLRVDPKQRWPTLKALLAELENDRLVAGRDRFAAGAAAKLAGAWEAPTLGRTAESPGQSEIRQSFLATGKGYATTAFDSVSRLLDDYASDWSNLYIDACEATHLRGEQSAEVLDLKMAFLHERLDELRALCRIFRHASADVVENAVTAAGALRALDSVHDVKLLRAVVRPPRDSRTQTVVDAQRVQLAEARVLGQVGRLGDALRMVEPLEKTARELGYGPVAGSARHFAGAWSGGARALEEALWTAEISRHDEVAAEAATALVYITGDAQLRFEAGEIWARHAEAVLRRMGGHDRLWGWLFNNRSAMRQKQGRLTEALADAREAVAIKERSGGPDSPDVALSLSNVAIYLAQLGSLAEAEHCARRAVEIAQAGLGPGHPRTAVLLSNYGEILNRLGRFGNAREMAQRALDILEGEVESDGLILTYPLTVLGVGFLDDGMAEHAVPILERAVKIRDVSEIAPVRLGEVHFALARALTAVGGDRRRARELARTAGAEYGLAVNVPGAEQEIERIGDWRRAIDLSESSAGLLSGDQP